MAPYSSDTDLQIYEQDLENISLDFKPLHAEAEKEINRILRAKGLTNDDISHLTEQSLEDLISVSCEYVLFLAYNSAGARETANDHYRRFNDRMGNTRIEVDKDADGIPEVALSDGTVQLG